MKITCDAATRQYVPPVAGNGALSLLVDYRGAQGQREYHGMVPAIWWAGRRYDSPGTALVPFGHFDEAIAVGGSPLGEPVAWQQSLDTDRALIESRCAYDGGVSVDTTLFVHLAHNVVALRKRLTGCGEGRYRFTYRLAQSGAEGSPPRRMEYTALQDAADGGVDIRYVVDGQDEYRGVVSLFSETPMAAHVEGNVVTLAADFQGPAEFTVYLLFADSVDDADFAERARRLKQQIRRDGFAGFRASHQQAWAQYWAESLVELPSPKLQEVYATAQYHLRCASTQWSMPIGIFPTHWQGRYFAFDEFFSFLALLGSNHLDVAGRIPDFRHAGLNKALSRTLAGAAHYPWETLENGEEGAPAGFWMDHVFHMASVALEAWRMYEYTGDRERLQSKGYPVIRACAEFFRQHMVYSVEGGRTIVGKCSDFERLGSAKENAFCTTCSVIATLDAAAEAVDVLGITEAPTPDWRDIARRLRASLPHNGERYVPYPGCEQQSIGVLGGLYPYTAIGVDDEKQRRAIDGFCDDSSVGNMYPVGKSVCTWYAAWMAVVLARLGERARACEALQQAAASTGSFAEIYEINEAGVVFRPWFSTAEGTYIQAVHEILLQSSPDEIRIAPATPADWDSFAFRLRCHGDIVVDARVAAGKLQTLKLHLGRNCPSERRILVIPQALYAGGISESVCVERVSEQRGQVRVTLALTPGTPVVTLIDREGSTG